MLSYIKMLIGVACTSSVNVLLNTHSISCMHQRDMTSLTLLTSNKARVSDCQLSTVPYMNCALCHVL